MLKLCKIHACSNGTLGLHLSRAPWDPYPWVSGIQAGSSAAHAGMRVGDTVLELNGSDVLGQKIAEIATRIRAHWDSGATNVTLLIWRNDADTDGDDDDDVEDAVDDAVANDEHAHRSQSSHHGINQQSLQKFATCLQHVAQLLECPVCLEIVKPPGWQCCNGHVMCNGCRSRSVKCPVCRVPLGPRGRCLLSDKLFTLLAESFPCEGVTSNSNSPNHTRKCSTLRKSAKATKTTPTTELQQFKAKEINKKVKSFGQHEEKVDKMDTALVIQAPSDSAIEQQQQPQQQQQQPDEAGNKIPTYTSDNKTLQRSYWQQRCSRTSKVQQQETRDFEQQPQQQHQSALAEAMKSCEHEQLSGSSNKNNQQITTTSATPASSSSSAIAPAEATSRYNNVLVKLKLKTGKKAADCSAVAVHC